ncbi:MAG: phosphodiesterase [Armatimonadota bacterium]|jgi:putative phosphoesterase
MKIGIIADTHGNVTGWDAAMEVALEGSDLIVHCGDVLYHGPKFAPAEAYDPMALAGRINASDAPVLIARGNGDSDVDQLVLDVPVQSPYCFAQVEGLRILAAHGHTQAPEELLPLAEQWGIGLLLTGHSHVPVLARYGDLLHLNPGTVTYPLAPDGPLHRRTCAVWEDGEVAHFDIESGETVSV